LIFLSFQLSFSEQVVSESNGVTFHFLGRISTGGDSYDVQVIGDIAYVTCGYSGLKIFNISNPLNLIELGSLPEDNFGPDHHSGYAHQFFIDFPLMYIGDGRGGLHIVNVSDSKNPSSLSHFIDYYSWDIQIVEENGDKIAFTGNGFMGDANSGLAILNVTNPLDPILLGQIKTGGDVTDLKIVGKRAILLDGTKGLTIVNVSSFSNPKILGFKSLNQNMGALEVIDNVVYTVNYQEGLKIFNISNPGEINLIKEFSENMSSTWDVKVDYNRNFVYVVDTELGLKIIDIKDLTKPVLVAEYLDDSLRYNNVFISEDRVYLNTNHGLTILDLKIDETNSFSTSTTTDELDRKTTSFTGLQVILIGLMVIFLFKKRKWL
jgi:hypothetical protein